MNLVKLALRSNRDLPVGSNGGLHLECPCGRQVHVYDTDGGAMNRDLDNNMPCSCGRVYDIEGYVVRTAASVPPACTCHPIATPDGVMHHRDCGR